MYKKIKYMINKRGAEENIVFYNIIYCCYYKKMF